MVPRGWGLAGVVLNTGRGSLRKFCNHSPRSYVTLRVLLDWPQSIGLQELLRTEGKNTGKTTYSYLNIIGIAVA